MLNHIETLRSGRPTRRRARNSRAARRLIDRRGERDAPLIIRQTAAIIVISFIGMFVLSIILAGA